MHRPGSRSAFVEAELVTRLAHQIRILRLQRNWTQRDLAVKLGTTQAAVSRLEDPSYGKASISTLLKLGAVFDVALNVRFGSFVQFFKEAMSPDLKGLEVMSFDDEASDVGFHSDLSSSVGISFKNQEVTSQYFSIRDGSSQQSKQIDFGETSSVYLRNVSVEDSLPKAFTSQIGW